MKIIGIDPGSERTGYGLLEVRAGGSVQVLGHGVLRASAKEPIHERLRKIHDGLNEILEAFLPDVMAVEEIFFARDARSSITLGQVRGVILLSGAQKKLAVVPYAATRVKQTVSGSGRADKLQVQRMVTMLLKLPELPPADAADALAIALCHASHFRMQKISQVNS